MKLAAETLWTNKSADILAYLYKRGLSDNVLRAFNFGYCPADVDHMLAGRIIMPLYDAYGKLIAVTSRNPFCEKRFQHWHESFDKGAYLYGINVAKTEIIRTQKAIIVEGQFDVTCLHSYGFGQTAGVLGSAFTVFHLIQLARMCSEVFIVLDSDESGESGKDRALELAEIYQLSKWYAMRLVPVRMPPKVDPDEFVIGNGPSAFADLLKKSKERIINGYRF